MAKRHIPKIKLVQNKQYDNKIDVEIDELFAGKKRDILSIGLFLYPYARTVNASHYEFLPYEDYANEVAEGKKSPYFTIKDASTKLFGLLLGLLILIIFLLLDVKLLYSVEAIVSIAGAYAIGKELWVDIELALRRFTKSWWLSWRRPTYSLQREDYGTIQRFYKFARKKRYGIETILATYLDLTSHSNSKTIDLRYRSEDLERVQGALERVLTIEIAPEKLKDLQKKGYFFSVRITLSKKILGVELGREYFQCLDNEKLGIIDEDEKWILNTIMHRRTISIGRVKMYFKKEMKKMKLIEF